MPSAVAASVIMDRSGALLNDPSCVSFTYAKQLPHLQIAYDELAEKLEENNVQMTNEVSSVLAITTAMTDIGGSTGPALPDDLIEIQSLWERATGTTDDYTEMSQVRFLPETAVLSEALMVWAWQAQVIRFIGATANRDVKIHYVGLTLSAISSSSSTVALFNAKNFLAFRTAALCSEFIGENTTRAGSLNGIASAALERLLNLNIKNEQDMPVRRRPFMAGYRGRGY